MVTNAMAKIYETVLSSPGMNDNIKFELRMSRKNALLINRLIEAGLSEETLGEDEIFQQLPKESIEELQVIGEEILRKAGLIEFYEKLKSI